MISLEKAYKLAQEHFRELWGEVVFIQRIQETKDMWIMRPGSNEDLYGPVPLSVDKNTGKIESYPTQMHFDELKKARTVKILKIGKKMIRKDRKEKIFLYQDF